MTGFVEARNAEILKAADRVRAYVRRTATLTTDLDPDLRLIGIGARVAWTRLHVALEPTGALPLAAYLAGKLPGGRAGLILSGGNANLETVAKLLGTP